MPTANHPSRVRLLALYLIVFAILLCRRPESLFKPQFWAEDGAVFFADQISVGFWHAVITPYSGYFHLIPRIVAGAFNGLHVLTLPAAYALSALVMATLCCCVFAWPGSRWLISSDLLRFACCVVMASAIPSGLEVIGTICNLQWFLAPAAILITFGDQQFHKRSPGRIITLSVLALISLSTPALLVIVPLLFWQIIRNTGWQRGKSAVVLVGIGIELLEVIHTKAGGNKPHWNFDSVFISTIAGGIAKSVIAPVLGHPFLFSASTRSLVVKLLLTLIITVVLLTSLLLSLRNRHRTVIVLSAFYIGLASVAVVMGGRNLANSFLNPDNIPYLQGERYFFLPSCVFIFLLAFGAEFLMTKARGTFTRVPVLLFLAAFGWGIIGNFKSPPMADLSWPVYAAKIDQWRQSRKQGQPVSPLLVPLNPPPFSMTLQP